MVYCYASRRFSTHTEGYILRFADETEMYEWGFTHPSSDAMPIPEELLPQFNVGSLWFYPTDGTEAAYFETI